MSSKLREVERERTCASARDPVPSQQLQVPVVVTTRSSETSTVQNLGATKVPVTAAATIVNEDHHLYERASRHDDVDNAFGDSPSSSKGN